MEWISVEERLPEDYKKVLVRRDNNLYGTFEDIESGWYASPDPDWEEEKGDWFTMRVSLQRQLKSAAEMFNGRVMELPPVTHWMPLPEPPKEETDE